MPLVMFSKMLQEFSVAEAARRIKGLGFDGVDLTVRPKGHVEPANVGLALPEAVKVIKDQGLTVPMISTAITSADDPAAEPTLAAAVHEGIRYLKLGYWNTTRGGLVEAIDQARHALDGLTKLAEKYHVTLGVHNHSGASYVNCQPAVLWMLLKDRDPARIASYFDPGHAAVEGGDGGGRQALELLGPQIRMVAVKDFGWKTVPGQPKVKWASQLVPLREGLVPWPEVFASLKALKFAGPISMHSEYQGSHSWRDLSTPELIAQTAEDLAFVRELMSR